MGEEGDNRYKGMCRGSKERFLKLVSWMKTEEKNCVATGPRENH